VTEGDQARHRGRMRHTRGEQQGESDEDARDAAHTVSIDATALTLGMRAV
jgi:hypothetical protein